MNKIINGDSLKVLKKLENESVDLICTDPPYGYSFMGKDWDKVVPSVEIWKECLRVLKPGGFCFVMSAPRIDVQSRMGTKLEDAGFQTNFSPIYWTYATGFPKATNVGKAVDRKLNVKQKIVGQKKAGALSGNSKFNDARQSNITKDKNNPTQAYKSGSNIGEYDVTIATSDEAKQLDGSYVGYQPKPAVEVILVCMKPIEEKSYIEQAMKNGKGITWLDDCRIPYKNDDDSSATLRANTKGSGRYKDTNRAVYGNYDIQNEDYDPTNGRFAANLIVQDDVLNDGKNRKGGTSNGDAKVGTKTDKAVTPLNRGTLISRNDEGSFSRFYDLDAWWKSQIHKLPESVQKTFPFMVVAKASKSEKNKGLDDNFEEKLQANANYRPSHLEEATSGSNGKPHGRYAKTKNNHPTVKPIELMSYLITLGSRDNDVVVDPFVGSGTTCIAAKLLNRQYIGIEKEKDYAIIAKARIKNVESKENNKASQFFEL
jgi:site-specific DNA-methyltransferase (adenine-specific)